MASAPLDTIQRESRSRPAITDERARGIDIALARRIARERHHHQVDRFGEPMIDHISRVAALVPPRARALAWLHDVLERSNVTEDELVRQGLDSTELAALRLLTRAPGESYELHALRVAHACGPEGALARVIKLADLDDHLGQAAAASSSAPPYRWARRHIALADSRADRVRESSGLARRP